jgi:hypothetical protein
MRLRFAFERLGGGARPSVEPTELFGARTEQQAAEAAWDGAMGRVLREVQRPDLFWLATETLVLEHREHGELHVDEQWQANEQDAGLVDRVVVRIICGNCGARAPWFVTPPEPTAPEALTEQVGQLRADLTMVVETCRRPPKVHEELAARYRRIEIDEFAHQHRAHGRLEAGDGHPARLGLGGPVKDMAARVFLRCRGCGGVLPLEAETPAGAAALLAELQAAVG